MRASVVLALFGAAVAMAADGMSGQPACATACLMSAISAAGCKPDDSACQCGPSKSDIGTNAAPCLLQSCQASELFQAQSAGNAACLSYSATATLTGVSSSASTHNASTTSGAPSTGAGASTSKPASTAAATTTSSSKSASSAVAAAAAATPVAWGPAGALVALLGAVVAL